MRLQARNATTDMQILEEQITELNGNVTVLVARAPGEPAHCSCLAAAALAAFHLSSESVVRSRSRPSAHPACPRRQRAPVSVFVFACAALLQFVEQLNFPGAAASEAVDSLVALPDQLLSITNGISRGTRAVEDNFNKASWSGMHACMPGTATACLLDGSLRPAFACPPGLLNSR